MTVLVQLVGCLLVGVLVWPPAPIARPRRQAAKDAVVVAIGMLLAGGGGGRWRTSAVARRLALPVVGFVVATTASVPLGLSLLVVAPVARRLDRARVERGRRSALDAALPEAIDLCAVVLGAGGTIPDCLDALALDGPRPIRPTVAAALTCIERGERVDKGLRWLQLELGPSFQPLTGTMLLAREHGGSIGVLLARLSLEANASRRRLGELRARRLPVALLIPLVVCSLPAVIIGTVVPVAIVALTGIDI